MVCAWLNYTANSILDMPHSCQIQTEKFLSTSVNFTKDDIPHDSMLHVFGVMTYMFNREPQDHHREASELSEW